MAHLAAICEACQTGMTRWSNLNGGSTDGLRKGSRINPGKTTGLQGDLCTDKPPALVPALRRAATEVDRRHGTAADRFGGDEVEIEPFALEDLLAWREDRHGGRVGSCGVNHGGHVVDGVGRGGVDGLVEGQDRRDVADRVRDQELRSNGNDDRDLAKLPIFRKLKAHGLRRNGQIGHEKFELHAHIVARFEARRKAIKSTTWCQL